MLVEKKDSQVLKTIKKFLTPEPGQWRALKGKIVSFNHDSGEIKEIAAGTVIKAKLDAKVTEGSADDKRKLLEDIEKLNTELAGIKTAHADELKKKDEGFEQQWDQLWLRRIPDNQERARRLAALETFTKGVARDMWQAAQAAARAEIDSLQRVWAESAEAAEVLHDGIEQAERRVAELEGAIRSYLDIKADVMGRALGIIPGGEHDGRTKAFREQRIQNVKRMTEAQDRLWDLLPALSPASGPAGEGDG